MQESIQGLSIEASQSLTASLIHDSATSTCSAPSFKFAVHDRSALASSPDVSESPGCLMPHAFTLDACGSSAPAFSFPQAAHSDDESRQASLPGKAATVAPCSVFPRPLQLSGVSGHGTAPTGMILSPDACPPGSDGSASMQACVPHSAGRPFIPASYSALTPCAAGPVHPRLETVDEHTPSPMHPLQEAALHIPPGYVGKARPGLAAMMHVSSGMHGEPSPDITWSPLRQRGMRLPSPNYSSPAALGAAHAHALSGHFIYAYGHTQLPILESSSGPEGQVSKSPVSPSDAADESDNPAPGNASAGGLGEPDEAGERDRGGAGRRLWLCMTSPRTKSADGGGHATTAASEAVAEAGTSRRERDRGVGGSMWRRQQQGRGGARSDVAVHAPRLVSQEGARELSLLSFGGSASNAVLPCPGDVSASVGGASYDHAQHRPVTCICWRGAVQTLRCVWHKWGSGGIWSFRGIPGANPFGVRSWHTYLHMHIRPFVRRTRNELRGR